MQKRLYSLPNVTVLKNVQLTEITGSDKVDGLTISIVKLAKNSILISGVFVQIGLVPNTDWLDGTLERNRFGEIIVDDIMQLASPGICSR